MLTATDRYYRVNTRQECVDPAAANFDFQANLGDSALCDTSFSAIDTAFGGVFQRCNSRGRDNVCSIHMFAQPNPLTGDFSCPAGYTEVQLFSGTDSYVGLATVHLVTLHTFLLSRIVVK